MTTACLRDVGIMLCLRLLFTIAVMTGRRDGRICFRMFVGKGSRQHDLEFPSKMSFEICSSDTSWNKSSFPVFSSAVCAFDEGWLGDISLRIFAILSMKNSQFDQPVLFWKNELVVMYFLFCVVGQCKFLTVLFDHFLHNLSLCCNTLFYLCHTYPELPVLLL